MLVTKIKFVLTFLILFFLTSTNYAQSINYKGVSLVYPIECNIHYAKSISLSNDLHYITLLDKLSEPDIEINIEWSSMPGAGNSEEMLAMIRRTMNTTGEYRYSDSYFADESIPEKFGKYNSYSLTYTVTLYSKKYEWTLYCIKDNDTYYEIKIQNRKGSKGKYEKSIRNMKDTFQIN